MRCQKSCVGVASLLALVGCASLALAQTGFIVLIQDSQGNQVYINTSPTIPQGGPPRARGAGLPRPAVPRPKTSNLRALPVSSNFQTLVEKTAGRLQVDPKLVNAIIRVESEYNPRAVSSKGAMGLMQLIPATAERFGVEDPFDPGENIQGGVTFLRYLLDRFNGNVPLSVAAYNAGENRVGQDGGIPAIPETVDYVRKVTSLYGASHAAPVSPASARASAVPKEDPIYRYVDEYGVVHFAND